MAYYKIKNITSTLSKRHDSNNKSLEITYNVGFLPKVYNLEVDNEMIISCGKLPVNIHSLRVKGLITVQEISENEFIKSQRPNAKKPTSFVPVRKKSRTSNSKFKEEKVEQTESKPQRKTKIVKE